MNTKNLVMAIFGGLLLAPTWALAAEYYEVVNGEKGVVFQDTPSVATREQVISAMGAGSPLAFGWRLTGGESGWVLAQASYVFEDGKLVHAADCPLLTAEIAPKTGSEAAQPLPDVGGA